MHYAIYIVRLHYQGRSSSREKREKQMSLSPTTIPNPSGTRAAAAHQVCNTVTLSSVWLALGR